MPNMPIVISFVVAVMVVFLRPGPRLPTGGDRTCRSPRRHPVGCKQAPGSIDCYAKAEPDEPMFILLARDASAPQLIEMWADLRERHDEEAAVVAEAREIAEQMRAWRDHNREPIAVRTILEHRVDHEHTETDVIRHAKIDEPADPSPYACIDGGTCHHTCTDEECYRALNCAPLSGTMLNDQWPSDARPVWRQA